MRPNNDGTIALASLMDFRPQSEAKMNYTFDEDHISILTSEAVIEQYNTILDKCYEKQDVLAHRQGGYLKVDFTYNYDFSGIRPRPVLVLFSAKKQWTETVTYLGEKDNGRVLGPFSAGEYRATMVAMAAKPLKRYVSVSIESGQTQQVGFEFEPDGEIIGCVTAALAPDEKYIGRPDYLYRSADENIRIQSLHLQGGDVQRTLQPFEKDNIKKDYLIARDDYCVKQCFGFFGLPAGDYTLSINAEGYKTVENAYSVQPGIPNYFRVTELTPE